MRGTGTGLIATVLTVLLLTAGFVAAETSMQHYKMISTVEYSGQGQFRNQVETSFAVEKQELAGGKVRFSLQSEDLDSPMSFVVDRSVQHVSGIDGNLAFLANASNVSAKAVKKVTKENVGKTWKQGVDLRAVDASLPHELRFTLTAIQEDAVGLGELIAVRALSEPFAVETAQGPARARINTLYLFDSEIEDVYLSMSVFETVAVVNGTKEVLRHEVATYKIDASGAPVDLSVLSEKFQALASKVGLSKKSMQVTESTPLPAWAKSEGLRAAQVAHVCSATVCEGALNPVSTVALPAAKVIELQKNQSPATADALLADAEGGDGAGDKSIMDKLFGNFGWNWQTFGIIGGAVAVPVALSGGGGGGGGGVASP